VYHLNVKNDLGNLPVSCLFACLLSKKFSGREEAACDFCGTFASCSWFTFLFFFASAAAALRFSIAYRVHKSCSSISQQPLWHTMCKEYKHVLHYKNLVPHDVYEKLGVLAR
jgi:hypothetical protein